MNRKDKLLARCQKSALGCWEWQGAKNNKGYGISWHAGKKITVHRLSYILHNGEIPKEKMVLHSCDNRSCANPDHLFLGTGSDNQRDMAAKGRQFYQQHPEKIPWGENNPGAKLTDKQREKIQKEYLKKRTRQKDLAARYGVTQSVISKIIRNFRFADYTEVPLDDGTTALTTDTPKV